MDLEKTDFDARAPLWDADQRRAQLASAVLTALHKAVPLGASMNVLELGAGTGLVTMGLAPIVRSLTALDGSVGMLNVLKEKIVRLQLSSIYPLHADAEADWPPIGPFHLIVGSMMMHHVANVERLFQQALAALEPGGFLAMADLDQEPGDFHDDNSGVRHFGFSRPTLEESLRGVGFTDVHFLSVTTMTKGTPEHPRYYQVFLVTARKPQPQM